MSEYVSYGIPGIAFLGVLLLFWGVATLVGGGASESSMEARMARYAGGPEAKKEEKVKKKKERKDIDPFATLSSDVQDKHLAAKVARDLARANLTLRVSEYYYIRIGLALGLGLFLGVLRDPLSGVVGAIVGYFGPRIWVGRRIGSRLNSFNKQLPDTIAFTIRERARIKGEIRTLTAQGRYSGYLVAFLPVGIAVTLNFINPEFMQPLFTQLIGQILLVIGGVMMAIGFFAIRKITDIKV